MFEIFDLEYDETVTGTDGSFNHAYTDYKFKPASGVVSRQFMGNGSHYMYQDPAWLGRLLFYPSAGGSGFHSAGRLWMSDATPGVYPFLDVMIRDEIEGQPSGTPLNVNMRKHSIVVDGIQLAAIGSYVGFILFRLNDVPAGCVGWKGKTPVGLIMKATSDFLGRISGGVGLIYDWADIEPTIDMTGKSYRVNGLATRFGSFRWADGSPTAVREVSTPIAGGYSITVNPRTGATRLNSAVANTVWPAQQTVTPASPASGLPGATDPQPVISVVTSAQFLDPTPPASSVLVNCSYEYKRFDPLTNTTSTAYSVVQVSAPAVGSPTSFGGITYQGYCINHQWDLDDPLAISITAGTVASYSITIADNPTIRSNVSGTSANVERCHCPVLLSHPIPLWDAILPGVAIDGTPI
jgi:hypothetical protein